MGIAGFFLWLSRQFPECVLDPITGRMCPSVGSSFPRWMRIQQEKPPPKPEQPTSPTGDSSNVDGVPVTHEAGTAPILSSPPVPPASTYLQIDNLYLDMNGLIHPCCHDTAPLPEPQNEEEMLCRIFEKIDQLVSIAKPQKVLVLAVDGVAPRSKMNQQRMRRFRAAEERKLSNELNADIAKDVVHSSDGLLPPPEIRQKWDHNVITPATAFMERVGNAIEWFVMKKLNDDSATDWKHLTVVFCDAHVPGEGEHKIMHYIRGLRAADGYDPNTVHCVHGMDADLIVLGLATHEPQFYVLRNQLNEEFQQMPDKYCVFSVIHLRKCLQRYFFRRLAVPKVPAPRDRKRQTVSKYRKPAASRRSHGDANDDDEDAEDPFEQDDYHNIDFERLVDDFVALCFLVGNDFLPHMPLIDIKCRGIETMVGYYLSHFPDHLYLTCDGDVRFARLRCFLKGFVSCHLDELFELRTHKDTQWEKAVARQDENLAKLQEELQRAEAVAAGVVKRLRHAVPSRAASGALFAHETTPRHRRKGQSHGKRARETDAEGDDNGQPSVVDADGQETDPQAAHLQNSPSDGHEPDNSNDSSPAATVDPQEAANALQKARISIIREQQRVLRQRPQATYVLGQGDYRKAYYVEKFGFTADESDSGGQQFQDQVRVVCHSYLQGMQWVLKYYTHGCPTWSWCYRFHFAPLIEDLAYHCQGVTSIEKDAQWMKSERGPSHPVVQLLSVLPRESVLALPTELHDAVLDSNSPLSVIYPAGATDVDYTDATFNYQGVLKLPFIHPKKVRKLCEAIYDLDDATLSMQTLVFVRSDTPFAKHVERWLRLGQKTDAAGLLPVPSGDDAGGASADGDASTDDANADKAHPDAGEYMRNPHVQLHPIPRPITQLCPIAGRMDHYTRADPLRASVECPDAGLAEASPETWGTPIASNHVRVYTYDMMIHAGYVQKLLPGAIDEPLPRRTDRKATTTAGGNVHARQLNVGDPDALPLNATLHARGREAVREEGNRHPIGTHTGGTTRSRTAQPVATSRERHAPPPHHSGHRAEASSRQPPAANRKELASSGSQNNTGGSTSRKRSRELADANAAAGRNQTRERYDTPPRSRRVSGGRSVSPGNRRGDGGGSGGGRDAPRRGGGDGWGARRDEGGPRRGGRRRE